MAILNLPFLDVKFIFVLLVEINIPYNAAILYLLKYLDFSVISYIFHTCSRDLKWNSYVHYFFLRTAFYIVLINKLEK